MRALAILVALALALVALPGEAVARRVRTGRLEVKVSVEGAEIAIDGTTVDRSPMKHPIKLRVGTHSLKVSKPGHAEFLDVVKIEEEEVTTVEVDLLPFAANVSVTSDPPGAIILVDGQPIGKTPHRGEIDPGEHELKLVLDGYIDAEKKLELVAGESYEVKLGLVAVPRPIGPAKAPIYKQWWFWTAAGAVVVGTATTAILLSGGDDPLAGADRVIRPEW